MLVASQVVPKIALAPLLLIWLGFGISSKVLIVTILAFFPIVVNGVIGLQAPGAGEDLSRSIHGSEPARNVLSYTAAARVAPQYSEA